MNGLGFWDYALLILVSAQATLLASIPHPRWKAFITALPIPFTLAALALGRPIGPSHVVALNVLLAYAFVVRFLHEKARWPIIPAIAAAAVGYVLAGAGLRTVLPENPAAFWLSIVLTGGAAAVVRFRFQPPAEPDHHKLLPPWLKFPMVAGVVLVIILLKSWLQGFMTLFPMIGVFAAYEGRFRLAAFCRAFSAFALAMVPLLAVVRLIQPKLGWGAALAAGWLVFLPILWLEVRSFGKREKGGVRKESGAAESSEPS